MTRRGAVLVVAIALAGCASASDVPPAETPYFRAKLGEAAALPASNDAGRATPPVVPAPAPRADALDPSAAIVDLDAPATSAFVARLRDPSAAEAALAGTPLDTDLVLAAVWVRNPAVARARADVETARRVYEQASWLEDLETRIRSAAMPMTNPRAAMESAPLEYPGTAALRGEMLDLETAMAAARLRMTFLESAAGALDAFHTAIHHEGEVAIRREQVSVLERLVAASRSRVEAGRAPQAEMLESQAELAMSRSDLEHALTALDAARRRFNAYLDRAQDAPFAGRPHDDPPETTPATDDLLAAARRWSPEIAMTRAEAARVAVAERMAGRMVNPGRGPGAATMPSGAMAASPELVPPAWAAELASRRVAAERAADEAVRNVERMVADMAYELASMARMFRVTKSATEPAARQSLDERMRLYENGRGEFTDVLAAAKRHLDARHDLVTALHDYRVMEARLWMAVGARPDLAKGTSR